jgi:hypothetical protein
MDIWSTSLMDVIQLLPTMALVLWLMSSILGRLNIPPITLLSQTCLSALFQGLKTSPPEHVLYQTEIERIYIQTFKSEINFAHGTPLSKLMKLWQSVGLPRRFGEAKNAKFPLQYREQKFEELNSETPPIS